MTSVVFNPKIIFFDIDDTLSRNSVLAPHNAETLKALAKTKVKLAIATGRSKSIIPEDILALLEADIFDAIVCTNGQLSFDNKGMISHYPLTQKQAQNIATICQDEGVIHKFDSATHLAWSKMNERIAQFSKVHQSSILAPDYYQSNTVYQCSVFFNSSENKLQHVDFASHDLKLVHWHSMGGDILPIEASKARGVQDICDHFAIDVSEAMAIGDGFNDLEMFDLVGFAVAMGDGQPAVKDRADLITGSIEDYGLQKVLEPLIDKLNAK